MKNTPYRNTSQNISAARILLVDDHEIICQGIKAVLEKHYPQFEVVGEAHNGRICIEMIEECNPNIVIMDISMPDLNGIDSSEIIKKRFKDTKIIIFSMHQKKQFIIELLKIGVSGYVLKSDTIKGIVDAIIKVVEGNVYLSPAICGLIADDYVQKTLPTYKERILTPREREILQLIAEGVSTKNIAANLHISVKTVESTRNNIMHKLNVHHIAGLTKYAVREGLTTLDY